MKKNKAKDPRWFQKDSLARDLAQLTEKEFYKFACFDLLDVRPVILPMPEHVVSENDYFMWPIATMAERTMVVLYQRTPGHHVWGGDCTGKAGIYQYSMSLDTCAVREYLMQFYNTSSKED